MKIAIPTNPPGGLQATLNHHFGQTKIFTIVNIDEDKIKEINIVYQEGPHACAGVVDLIQNTGAESVIVGGIGGRPLAIMQERGMRVFTADSGKVEDLITALLKGSLQEINNSTCSSH